MYEGFKEKILIDAENVSKSDCNMFFRNIQVQDG